MLSRHALSALLAKTFCTLFMIRSHKMASPSLQIYNVPTYWLVRATIQRKYSLNIQNECLSLNPLIRRRMHIQNPLSSLPICLEKGISSSSFSKYERFRSHTALPFAGYTNAETAAALFTFGTALVVPLYTVMIFVPRWNWTEKIVKSNIPYIILGALYIYLLSLSWTKETLGLMFASQYWLPQLQGISTMFKSTVTVASAWMHLLAVDLFVARHVFLDGLEQNVETRHSLVLCLMMCPIGLLSHLITKAITSFLRPRECNSVQKTVSSV